MSDNTALFRTGETGALVSTLDGSDEVPISLEPMDHLRGGAMWCGLAGGIVECRSSNPALAHTRIIEGLPPIVDLAIDGVAVALAEDGSVWTWDTFSMPHIRGQRVTVPAASAIAAGADFACSMEADGATWCWGANDRGQLGDPTRVAHATPVRVPLP